MYKLLRVIVIFIIMASLIILSEPVYALGMGNIADLVGTIDGSPVTLNLGNNIINVTGLGTLTVTLDDGNVGTATSGTCTVNGSPVALTAGANVITTAGVVGTITIYTALDDPTTITFGATPHYEAFYNMLETGDIAFMAEAYVDYATTPADFTAGQAFSFQVLNNAGTVVLASVPLNDYGDRPIGIYFSAADATSLGLVAGTLYKYRLSGNPAVFPVLTEGINMRTITLGAGNWADQSLATDTLNVMRALLLGGGAFRGMVFNINDTDSPGTDYYLLSGGRYYLNSSGSPSGQSLFQQGIPGLNVLCPSAFITVTSPMDVVAPPTSGAGQTPINVSAKLGTQIAATMSAITVTLGLPDTTAGRTVSGLIVAVGIDIAFIYWLSRKGVVDQRLLMVMTLAIIGLCTMFGIIPMAGFFVVIIIIVVLAVFYFFARSGI